MRPNTTVVANGVVSLMSNRRSLEASRVVRSFIHDGGMLFMFTSSLRLMISITKQQITDKFDKLTRGVSQIHKMTAISPTILALDFDGVICNGLIEYFQVAWRTYCKVWSCSGQTQTEDLANKFYHLRPVIETGWEMPVLIKALLEGFTEEQILQDWSDISHKILRQDDFAALEIASMLDKQRDEWIASDLDGWLSMHKFYPGVVEKIQSIYNTKIALYIVTTKEGRFVKELLYKAGFDLPREAIFGKEEKRPKYEILRELKQESNSPAVSLWFIEDRIKTLQKIKEQLDLEDVELFLANWGYNTPTDREAAQKDMRIQLISLSQFVQNFDKWQS